MLWLTDIRIYHRKNFERSWKKGRNNHVEFGETEFYTSVGKIECKRRLCSLKRGIRSTSSPDTRLKRPIFILIAWVRQGCSPEGLCLAWDSTWWGYMANKPFDNKIHRHIPQAREGFKPFFVCLFHHLSLWRHYLLVGQSQTFGGLYCVTIKKTHRLA